MVYMPCIHLNLEMSEGEFRKALINAGLKIIDEFYGSVSSCCCTVQ